MDPIHDIGLLKDLTEDELLTCEVELDAVDQVPVVMSLERAISVSHLSTKELATEEVVDHVGRRCALSRRRVLWRPVVGVELITRVRAPGGSKSLLKCGKGDRGGGQRWPSVIGFHTQHASDHPFTIDVASV